LPVVAELARRLCESAAERAPDSEEIGTAGQVPAENEGGSWKPTAVGRPRRTVIDIRILDLLESAGYLRRIEFVEKIAHENNCSLSLVNKKLAQLESEGKLLVVEYEDFGRFGIADTHRLASYIVLKGSTAEELAAIHAAWVAAHPERKVQVGRPRTSTERAKERAEARAAYLQNIDMAILDLVQSHNGCIRQSDLIRTIVCDDKCYRATVIDRLGQLADKLVSLTHAELRERGVEVPKELASHAGRTLYVVLKGIIPSEEQADGGIDT
jgi:hypothetical protein